MRPSDRSATLRRLTRRGTKLVASGHPPGDTDPPTGSPDLSEELQADYGGDTLAAQPPLDADGEALADDEAFAGDEALADEALAADDALAEDDAAPGELPPEPPR